MVFNDIKQRKRTMYHREKNIVCDRAIDNFNSLVKTNKAAVIFGAGESGYLVQRYLKRMGFSISLYIDNSEKKQGKKYHSVNIISPSEGVQQCSHGLFIIANLNLEHERQMFVQLQELGVEKERIVLCNPWLILAMQNSLHSQYANEDKRLIYHHPKQKNYKYYYKKGKAKVKAAGYKFLMDIMHPKAGVRKKYNVGICAIFKNEGRYLKEWIEYHKIVGVGHFYLYNNFSDDNYRDILKPYMQDGIVTLIDWPYHQGQMSAYRDCINNYRDQCQWIGFIDIDEFVLPIRDMEIYDFLRDFEKNRGSVLIYWKLFGSTGRQERDVENLVTEDFTVCWGKHSDTGKCFFNTNYDLALDDKKNSIMHHCLWSKYRGIKFPPVNVFDRVCVDEFHWTGRESFAIQINHYALKSYAEYQNKMRGTDVFFQENPHNTEAFLFHEEKCRALDVEIYKYLLRLKQKMVKRTEV